MVAEDENAAVTGDGPEARGDSGGVAVTRMGILPPRENRFSKRKGALVPQPKGRWFESNPRYQENGVA